MPRDVRSGLVPHADALRHVVGERVRSISSMTSTNSSWQGSSSSIGRRHANDLDLRQIDLLRRERAFERLVIGSGNMPTTKSDATRMDSF